MSEPTTEAGNFHDALHADDDPCTFGIYGTCDILDEIRAVQQEARANADRVYFRTSARIGDQTTTQDEHGRPLYARSEEAS